MLAVLGGLGYLLYTVHHHPPVQESMPRFSEMVGQLTTQRSEAEYLVHVVKTDCQEGRLSWERLRQLQALYQQAKAAFDGWIAQAESELSAGASARQQLEVSFQAALQRGDDFITQARRQQNFLGDEDLKVQPGPADPGNLDAAKGIVGLFVLVGNEYEAANQRERDRAIQQLWGARWRAFDEVP